MGRLIRFELKKVLADRRFLGIWLALLVLQAFLTVRGELPVNEYSYSPSEYEALYGVLQTAEPEAAVEELEARLEVIRAAEWAIIIGEDPAASPEGTEPETAEEPQDPRRQELRAAVGAVLPANEYAAKKLMEKVSTEISTVIGRDAMIARTIRRAEQMQSMTLFQGVIDERELGNLQKTGADFSGAASVPVEKISAERGITLVLEDPLADVFVFLMLFLAMHLMVTAGYGNGMETLVLSCREGRGKALASRAAALFLIAGLVWAGFFAVRSAAALILHSWGSLDRPVQMISEYIKCLFDLSVGGLLAICFLWKWLWFFLLIVLQMTVMKWLQREALADGLILGAWGVGFFLWEKIAENSVFRIWKYLNVYYLLRPDQIWAGYNNLRVGPVWVSGWLFAAVVTVILLAGSLLLLWLSRERILTKARSLRLRRRRTKPSFRGLLSAEAFKTFRVMHVGLLLLALFLLQAYQLREDEIRWDQKSLAYRSYLVQWERELSESDADLERTMEAEAEELQKGLLGESDRYSEEMAKVLSEGYDRAVRRYQEVLRTSEERGEPLYYFFEGEYVRLTASPERDIRHGAEAAMLVVLLIAWLAGREHSSGMRRMIRATGRGEAVYYRNKVLILAVLTILVMGLVYGPDLYLTGKTYGFGHAAASVGSLPELAGFRFDVSIGGYLVLLYAWRFLVLMLLGCGTLAVTELTRNTLVAALICVTAAGLPYLLYYLGAEWAVHWGLIPLLGQLGG